MRRRIRKERVRIVSGVLEEVIIEYRKSAATRMLKKEKYTNEEIAEVLELPLSVVESLLEEIKNKSSLL